MTARKRIVMFSGGSAANSLIDVFTSLCGENGRGLDFILPISDNGGSTSEIIRFFGGPGIGDVRSRLIRLVPENVADKEVLAIRNLLNHRLKNSARESKEEWMEILEGSHGLWKGISSEKRELIRSFFNWLNVELVKRQRPASSFNFQAASTGNLFLTGARIFFGSFESAIYLFRSITGVPEYIQVIPAINSNFAHHIAAGLQDGTVITGQNQISHPSPSGVVPPSEISADAAEGFCFSSDEEEEKDEEVVEDANLPGSLAELRGQNIEFSKTEEAELPSRIRRVWYINPYGQEIQPPANPKVLTSINAAEAIVYSIGSLYTSLAPILILRKIAKALETAPASVPRILLLNGSHDRETSPDNQTFTATEFVRTIVRCCVGESAEDKSTWKNFVTHVIYLEGNGAPVVDLGALKEAGVEPVRVMGRRNPVPGKGMFYDPVSLLQALSAILLKAKGRRPETRRNTVDGSVNGRNTVDASGNGSGKA